MLIHILILTVIGLLGLLTVLYYLYRPLYRPKYLDDLYDCHVVITGGSSGIGKELARQLLDEYGARVTILARNPTRLDECRRELSPNSSDRLLCLSVDISQSYDDVEHAIEQAVRHHGDRPVSILINNAAIFYARPFQETKPEEFHEMSKRLTLKQSGSLGTGIDCILVRINYLGSVYCTQACLALNQQRALQRIVFVSSQAGQLGVYGYTSYCSTKFALKGLAESLQMELARESIYITLVFPPDTDTPGFKEENKSKPKETQLINETSGVLSVEQVAKKTIQATRQGSFTCSYGLNGALLTCLTAGAQPTTTFGEIICQSLFTGTIRLIMFHVLHSFYKLVKKLKQIP
jgi:3-dehydrosphinganine reductase